MTPAVRMAQLLTNVWSQTWRAQQLLTLVPYVHDTLRVDTVVRPSIYEVAQHVIELLRPLAGPDDYGIPIFEGAETFGKPEPYSLVLRLDAEEEWCRHLRSGPGDERYERNKHEVPLRYLLDDGFGPEPYEGLVVWRAVRIWLGLARVFVAIGLAGKTFQYDDGTTKPVIDPMIVGGLRSGIRDVEAHTL